MIATFAALVPVFLLIVLGIVLRRILLKDDLHWIAIEQLVYYVLFPALLIDTLSRADLGSVPVAGVGGALLIALLSMTCLCLLLRPVLMGRLGLDGPAFSSVYQGANRWQTFIALSLAGALYGKTGIALASVAIVTLIPLVNALCVAVLAWYAAPQRLPWHQVLLMIARNPLIWACALGLSLNILHPPIPDPLHQLLDSLGRCALALGLLVVGAGLHLGGLLRPHLGTFVSVVLKLVVMPAIAISLGIAFGLSGADLAIVACCSAVPSAPSAYVLARQMGGDAPLMAQIITVQTVIAVATIPIFVGLAG